jgi:Carboxypeptidase regulatory-like domain
MSNPMRQAIRTLFLAVSFCFVSCVAHAQFDVGSLVGTIRDQSGAAVANASITVTNTATNIETSVSSNSSGDYL